MKIQFIHILQFFCVVFCPAGYLAKMTKRDNETQTF